MDGTVLRNLLPVSDNLPAISDQIHLRGKQALQGRLLLLDLIKSHQFLNEMAYF
ncbi:hypothetical protein D3C81_790730 [compost metagenome]